jgi:hypothetical protein
MVLNSEAKGATSFYCGRFSVLHECSLSNNPHIGYFGRAPRPMVGGTRPVSCIVTTPRRSTIGGLVVDRAHRATRPGAWPGGLSALEDLVLVVVENLVRYVDAELAQDALRHLHTNGPRVREEVIYVDGPGG